MQLLILRLFSEGGGEKKVTFLVRVESDTLGPNPE